MLQQLFGTPPMVVERCSGDEQAASFNADLATYAQQRDAATGLRVRVRGTRSVPYNPDLDSRGGEEVVIYLIPDLCGETEKRGL